MFLVPTMHPHHLRAERKSNPRAAGPAAKRRGATRSPKGEHGERG